MKQEKNRKKARDGYRPEKVSLRESLSVFKGIQLPVGLMILSVILSVAGAVAALNAVTFSGSAVDAAGNVPVKDMLLYVTASLLGAGLAVLGGITSQIAGEKIVLKVRVKLWDKIMSLHAKSFEKVGGETLVTRVSSDCQAAGDYFMTTMTVLTVSVAGIVYVVNLYQLNAQMANYMLLYIPVSFLLGTVFAILAYLARQKLQAKLAELGRYLIERLRDIPQIKTNSTQAVETTAAEERMEEYYRAALANRIAENIATVIGLFLDTLAVVIPFAIGAKMVAEGKMTIGSVVVFQAILVKVKGFFVDLIKNAGKYKSANGALARVTRLMKEKAEDVYAGVIAKREENQDIIVSGVDFSYTEDRKALDQLDCVIPKNQVTAILGVNGSGKSTLFKLVSRLYDPDEGTLRFGERDIREFSLDSWRKKVCLVQQDSPMMGGTIRENILYGRDRDISEEELLAIAKAAHVWDFVKDLPEGFDTAMEPGASNLSGGQKQCIAIARAMASDCEILLLDEATSALDAEREKDVLEALDHALQGRTTVIIAHSLSTVRKADQIIILRDGRVEEVGTKEEILSRTGGYLQKLQSRGIVQEGYA